MFAAAERRSSTGRWNTIACAAGGRSQPPHVNVAARRREEPCSRRSSVLLPAPLGPRMNVRPPRSIVEVDARRRIGVPPRAIGHAACRRSADPSRGDLSQIALSPRLASHCAAAFSSRTSAISTMPSPSASGRSPLLVSSAIVVVMTRVTPSMLPPTIITAPTSAIARPKPASSTVASENRVSHSSVSALRNVPRAEATSTARGIRSTRPRRSGATARR